MMKKLMFLFAFVAIACSGFSQVKIGLRAGLSTTDVEADQLFINNSNAFDEFTLAVQEAKVGVHAGLFAKIPIGDFFFLQPEVVFNSNRVDYERSELLSSISTVFSESYQYLDIPIVAGIQIGPLKPQIGLVGHVFLNSTSEFDLSAYRQDFESLTIGWQGGLGLEFNKILIDVKYEGNFSKFGNHIVIADQEYAFDDRPSRLIVTLGYAF